MVLRKDRKGDSEVIVMLEESHPSSASICTSTSQYFSAKIRSG